MNMWKHTLRGHASSVEANLRDMQAMGRGMGSCCRKPRIPWQTLNVLAVLVRGHNTPIFGNEQPARWSDVKWILWCHAAVSYASKTSRTHRREHFAIEARTTSPTTHYTCLLCVPLPPIYQMNKSTTCNYAQTFRSRLKCAMHIERWTIYHVSYPHTVPSRLWIHFSHPWR